MQISISKILMRLKLLCAGAIFFASTYGQQKMNTPVDNLIPPSPEAAALGEYAQVPVGLYTGTPDIGIPLYSLQEGSISVPVSLSYHASGHRVETQASRVGMGWVLNSGGVITRTIIGRPDEYGVGGFLNFARVNTPNSIYTGTDEEKFNRWSRLEQGCDDAEPDQFSFNFIGYTGQFSFNWSREIVTSSAQNVKIEPIGMPAPADNGYIQGWLITGEDGTQYRFEAKETNRTQITSITPCPITAPNVTSWYLTKITSANGAHHVYFQYDLYNLEYDIRSAELINHKEGIEPASPESRITRMFISGQNLSRITTSSGNITIRFTPGTTPRTDIPGSSANRLYSLDEIIVSNYEGTTIKHIKLGYGGPNDNVGRLTLKTVQELPIDGDNANTKPPYVFTYNALPLPAFTIGAPVSFNNQDHYGFMNSNTKPTLIPPYRLLNPDGSIKVNFDGGFRGSGDGSYAGMLTQIRYPAGGYTNFEYELHDYSFVGRTKLQNQEYIPAQASVYHSGENSGETWESRRTRFGPFHIDPVSDDPNTPEDESLVHFQSSIFKCDNLGTGVMVSLQKITGETVMNWATTESGTVRIPVGDYYLEATAPGVKCQIGDNWIWNHASIALEWKQANGWVRERKIAGGVRIKRIIDSDGVNTDNEMIRRYQYELFEIPEGKRPEDGKWVSSGVISREPQYAFDTFIRQNQYTAMIPYLTRMSASVVSLGTTQGSHIAYREVTVWNGENGEEGKSVSSFKTFYDINDDYSYSQEQPFPPSVSYDDKRGLLTKQTDFKNEQDVFTEVRRIENEYAFSDNNIDASVIRIKVGKKCNGCDIYSGGLRADEIFALGPHVFTPSIAKISRAIETTIEQGESLSVEKQFEYHLPLLQTLKKEIVKTSDGREAISEYSYPFDYTSAPFVYDVMKARHIFPVIEKIVKVRDTDKTEYVVDADFTQFDVNENNHVVPLQQLKFSSVSPVGSFTPSVIRGWPDYQYYSPVIVHDRYNVLGSLEQTTEPGDMVTSYIWSYGGSLPVAKITNAPFNRCAFTNFETNADKGNWLYPDFAANYDYDAWTGKRSFKGTITLNNAILALTPGKYIVSLWAKGIGGSTVSVNGNPKYVGPTWQRYEWIITNPNVSTFIIYTNNNFIDDLSLYPVEAQMSTSTYMQGVGVISKTDENHQTTYYEYDGYGRLKNTRDKNKNIRINYSYHYKN